MSASILAALRALGERSPVVAVPGVQPRPPVAHSRELTRILALPRHPGYSAEDRAAVEAALRRPGGTMTLRPHQADALLGALEAGGLFAPLQVGAGKTLLAALLPSMFPEVERPVVLTTAALARQAEVMIAEYRQHWHIRDDLSIVPYSTLSRTDASALLERLAPGLIVADEAHALRDKDSARTKRFLRYMKAHPETLFCALSGTLTKRSIKDFSTLIGLALGDWTPLPRDWPTLTEWAEALDPEPVRAPGALLQLPGAPGEGARERFARRVAETRGVAASPPEALGASLAIRIVPVARVPAVEAARRELARTWERLDGEELVTAMEVAAVDRQLRCGGSYLWETPPAREWLDARRAWHRAVRRWLADRAVEGIDSPALLEQAIDLQARAGRLAVVGPELLSALGAWRDARARFPEPPRVWRWLDGGEAAIDALVEGLEGPAVVFTDLVAVGRAVAERLGAPYFGGGPEAASAILEERGDRTIVVSLQAHGQGRNLQAWSRARVLGWPPSGQASEQLLGREHRSGQLADEVVYEVPSLWVEELFRARDEAAHLQATTGQTQKLGIAMISTEGT